jgi:1-acyl-sn-glycerol-3-phosphate acyltransferase
MDPFAHGYFVVKAGRRPRFLAKQELFENWFTRMVLLGAHQIPVRRGSGQQRPLQEAAAALEAGEIVVIYPEGTSVTDSPDHSPGRGKTGAVRLALATGVPILPVATWGGQYVWRRSGRGSLKFGRPIWLRAGEPIDLSPDRDRGGDAGYVRGRTDRLMDELGALVGDLRVRYPKGWSQG